VGDWEGPLKGHAPSASYGIPERIRRARSAIPPARRSRHDLLASRPAYTRASGEHLAVVSHVGVNASVQGSGAAGGLQCEVHRILQSEGARTMGLGTGGASIQAISF